MAKCILYILSSLMLVKGSRVTNVVSNQPHGHEYNIQNYYSKYTVNQSVAGKCQGELNDFIKKAKCIPRETVVHLTPTVYGLQMVTDKILVKRCLEIGCHGINSCVPTSVRKVRVPVLLRQSTCAWLEVVEHTACRCKCSLNANHCGSNQEFVEEQCACRCRNHVEKNECRLSGRAWDEKNCRCICPAEWMDCSTGTEWVPRMCKCVRVMSSDDNYNKYLVF